MGGWWFPSSDILYSGAAEVAPGAYTVDPNNCSDWCCYGSGQCGGRQPARQANNSTIDPETWLDSAGESVKKYVDIGTGTRVYSSTIGTIWSAATGTVDTDAKNILIHDQMIALMKASNFGTTWASVYAQSQGDVTQVLKMAKADPSDAGLGNNPGLDNLKKWLEIGVGLVAVYLVIELLIDFEVFKGGNK